MRTSIDYARELARRRQAGEASISYPQFEAEKNQRPFVSRMLESIDLHARTQYRLAVAEMYVARDWLFERHFALQI